MGKNNRREFLKRAALSGAGLGLGVRIPGLAAGLSGAGPAGVGLPGVTAGGTMTAGMPLAAGAGVGLPMTAGFPLVAGAGVGLSGPPAFIPRRAASWWTTLEDILWSEKKVVDRIKRRAEGFAGARIDTAINFGFHIRFDFSNYFGQLHGYYANVCEELHKYDIKFMEHYSCNHVERPRGQDELRELQRTQRHHVLLFHDPVAAKFAQYEGHYFNDLCEVDLRDGGRGYAEEYKLEVFCHNNPGFLDMHQKYLQRLKREVPIDGIQVDDMCDYAGITTCGCRYCRERFRRDYGQEIPVFGEKSFWGDTTGTDRSRWGNYENPVFRDWLRMKSDSVADHLKMIKGTVGGMPLMTCCSNAGPMVLNPIALKLEKMAPYLDFFMLENVGIDVKAVDWVGMDAEAMYQKDVAEKKNNAPAITISYMVFPKGGYLGWSLSRFWGVANWSSTLYGRLDEDPAGAMEVEEIMSPYNNWDILNSNLDDAGGRDLVEVRLVSSNFCRDNGWRGTDGREQWDRVKAWSALLVSHNIGYRLLRSEELSDDRALSGERTPLILDGVACVSDSQFSALQLFLSTGGTVWVAWPFGTHDEKGFRRKTPLSDALSRGHHKNLVVVKSAVEMSVGAGGAGAAADGGAAVAGRVGNAGAAVAGSDPLKELIAAGRFKPLLRQLSGNPMWAVRIRYYKEGVAIHFLYRGLVAVPHPTIKESSGMAVLEDFHAGDATGSTVDTAKGPERVKGSGRTSGIVSGATAVMDNKLEYEYETGRIDFGPLSLRSPELGSNRRSVVAEHGKNGRSILRVDLEGVETYAVAQRMV